MATTSARQPVAAPVAAPAVASGPVEVRVPDIGDFKDVAVIEVFVKPGDSIKVEQSLITVESDKASMEIPSSHAGVVQALKVAVGDKVNQGSLLAVIEAEASRTLAEMRTVPPPGTGAIPCPTAFSTRGCASRIRPSPHWTSPITCMRRAWMAG